jgi:hypothetical protein
MKSFTRVGLPILLVVGLVFGITFIQQYSADPQLPTDPTQGPNGKSGPGREQPLKVRSSLAAIPKEELGRDGEFRIPPHLLHLKYWDGTAEVGVPGYYAFWCENPNDRPVSIRVPSTNCQCAGADMAAVPPDAYREYLAVSALAGSPLCPVPAPAAALAHAGLARRLSWEELNAAGHHHADQTVPAATPADSQWALIRLRWKGKDAAGPRDISADLYAALPGVPVPSHYLLRADLNVVPAFEFFRRSGPYQWEPSRTLDFGDLTENAVVRQTIYVGSPTRRFMVLNATADTTDPCVTWTDPVPASPEEAGSLAAFSRDQVLRKGEGALIQMRSLYKVEVTVRERAERGSGGATEARELDLGLLERRLTITAANGGSLPVQLRGRVLGEVSILSGASDGRIDLGNSFPADQDQTKDVTLLADRPGLDLSLVEAETTPNYLKVTLEPRPPIDGRKQWRLRVTVPKGSLYGSLPAGSAVVLKTAGPNPRRFRVPVRGMTYDSGGPRL